MATKNIKVIGSNKAKDDTAGPGHRPTKPHPTPKSKDPIISFLSNFFFLKISNVYRYRFQKHHQMMELISKMKLMLHIFLISK